MREWFISVTAASVLSAIALALTPEGSVRQVEKTVCGIVCVLALMAPVVGIDLDRLSVSMALYEREAENIIRRAEEEEKDLERTYIQEQYAAYIWDKAEAMNIVLAEVKVTVRWDAEAGVWYPFSMEAEGKRNDRLAELVEGELGIPVSRQYWSDS